jgi:ubiquinone/menaquinone biosynthesis C-methylase UbiE
VPDKVEFWITDQGISDAFSGSYWNDEEIEKTKAFYILNGNADKLTQLLRDQTTLWEEFEDIIKFSGTLGLEIKGVGLDLAAGVCWSTALLSRMETVEKIYAVEISKHRLLKIAPLVLDFFKAESDKIIRVIGDFYNIKLEDNSIDFCFMSQAFHHANNPGQLLKEVFRILKPGGFILLIGESPILFRHFLVKYIKNIVKIITPFLEYKTKPIKKIFIGFNELYPPDKEYGDHYYRTKDYLNIFRCNNYSIYTHKNHHFTTFLAVKPRTILRK